MLANDIDVADDVVGEGAVVANVPVITSATQLGASRHLSNMLSRAVAPLLAVGLTNALHTDAHTGRTPASSVHFWHALHAADGVSTSRTIGIAERVGDESDNEQDHRNHPRKGDISECNISECNSNCSHPVIRRTRCQGFGRFFRARRLFSVLLTSGCGGHWRAIYGRRRSHHSCGGQESRRVATAMLQFGRERGGALLLCATVPGDGICHVALLSQVAGRLATGKACSARRCAVHCRLTVDGCFAEHSV
jgi:hypothetical protein